MVKGPTVVMGILIVASILSLFAAETEAGRKSPGKDIMIVVFDLSTTVKSDAKFASTVSEIIRKELKSMGSFAVLGRDEVDKVLSKYDFHYTDTCKSPACMSDIGHFIGVDRIIHGSIVSVNKNFNIVLHLLNVPRSEIIATVIADLKSDNKSVDSREIQTLIKNLMVKDGFIPTEPSEQTQQLSEQGETGKLLVDADRSGADIIIDGKHYEEKTPYAFKKFPVGKHKIVVSDKEGYGVKEITLSSGMSLVVAVPLSSKKEKVHISSSPENAKVIIEGKEYGNTPLTTDLWIGSHRVEIVKNNYLTRELIITVDSSSENRVELELEGIATVSVVAEPDYAHIYINGDYVGEGIVDNYSVKAGDVEISIEAPEYATYKTSETIEMGENKIIEKKLDYLFGSVEVTSHPDTASLFLNDVETGITPYTHTRLRTGKYKLTLIKNNYTGITEDVFIKPNEVLKREYTLKFSKAYRDSLRRERWLAHGARGLRRVLFSALGTVCGAAGYYFESKLSKNIENYTFWKNEYDEATGMDAKRFEEIKKNYYQEYNQARTNWLNRNMFISVAGMCGAGFFISIFF